MAFETPQEPQGKLVADLFEQYGLPETPSLEQIEPVAKELWGSPSTRLRAIELVLCRRVDAVEIQQDPLLKDVYNLQDVDVAFGLLLLYRSFGRQELAAEHPAE